MVSVVKRTSEGSVSSDTQFSVLCLFQKNPRVGMTGGGTRGVGRSQVPLPSTDRHTWRALASRHGTSY